MKNRIKIFILLLITIVIGFVIGFLVNGRIISYRIDKMRSNFSNTGFGHEVIRFIEPTPEQTIKLEPILSEYAHRNQDLLNDYHKEKEDLFIELKDQLADVLDTDQMNRLEEFNNRKNQRFQRVPKHRNRKPWRNNDNPK